MCRRLFTVSLFLALAGSLTFQGQSLARAAARVPLLRIELQLAPYAHARPAPLLMTLGGPVYCGQLLPLAQYLGASLLCPDYGANGEKSGLSRSKRVEDWGDPAYLAAVARLPSRLREQGVKISSLILVGASYAGYANTELVATHPELRPKALIVVDSFLDLRERYQALPPTQETRLEMTRVLGGTLARRPHVYDARSPSHHLAGIAAAMRAGMAFVDVWSIGADEQREFNKATCSRAANAAWLSELATMLGRPITGRVTSLPHADALRNWWRELLAFARIDRPFHTLPARTYLFSPDGAMPSGSYCY